MASALYPWLLCFGPGEMRAMLRAQWRRDENPAVEKPRRLYLIVLAGAIAYLVLGFPEAVWLLA